MIKLKVMPSWNIHLEAGERLADRLKLSGKERKEFLLGCLLPDINNGYINKVKTRKRHSETHYAYDEKSSLNFYAENKKKIDAREPLYLGYLFHLYTDGYYNYDFYHNVKNHPLGEGKTHEEQREIKHHDFWLYDTKFYHQLGLSEEERKVLAERVNEIKVPEITPEDIEDVEKILADEDINKVMRGEVYQFYTEKRLDELMEEMIQSFSDDYLKERDNEAAGMSVGGWKEQNAGTA